MEDDRVVTKIYALQQAKNTSNSTKHGVDEVIRMHRLNLLLQLSQTQGMLGRRQRGEEGGKGGGRE